MRSLIGDRQTTQLTQGQQQTACFISDLSFTGGLNFLGLDSQWVGVSALPNSLTSDVSDFPIEWGWLRALFVFESNLSSPYLGTCFTSRLVKFGCLISDKFIFAVTGQLCCDSSWKGEMNGFTWYQSQCSEPTAIPGETSFQHRVPVARCNNLFCYTLRLNFKFCFLLFGWLAILACYLQFREPETEENNLNSPGSKWNYSLLKRSKQCCSQW